LNASVAQVGAFENCASGLRYGLIDVEPFEEQKIVKKFGVKFRERRWGLKPSESFDDFLRFNTEVVIESISLPSHLDRATLIRVIAEQRIKIFEADTELKKLLESVQSAKGKSRGLKRVVDFFLNRQRDRMDAIFNSYAELFLASDLSLSFITEFTDFHVTYLAALEAIQSVVRAATVRMNLPEARSNFRRYERAFNAMKFKLSPIVEAAENAVFRAQALKWYVLLSNAESVETAFEPATIKRSKMNQDELSRLNWEFKQDSANLRRIVMEHDRAGHVFHPLVSEPDLKSHFGEIVLALTS